MHLSSFRHYALLTATIFASGIMGFSQTTDGQESNNDDASRIRPLGYLSEQVRLERITLFDTFIREEFGNLLDNGTFRVLSHTDLLKSQLTASILQQITEAAGRKIIEESRYQALKQEGTIPHWQRSSGTYLIGTTAYVEVCVTGYCDSSMAPNLAFIAPDDWIRAVYIMNRDGSPQPYATFFDDEPIFVSWTVMNTSREISSGPTTVSLYRDGTKLKSWEVAELAPRARLSTLWYEIGVLPAPFGTTNSTEYTFELRVDPQGLIAETSEIDNQYVERVVVARRHPPADAGIFPGQSAPKGSSFLSIEPLTNEIERLIVKTTGGSGDVDIYVGIGYVPTPGRILGGIVIDPPHYNYSSVNPGNEESIAITNSPAGTYNILRYAKGDFSGGGFSDVTYMIEIYFKKKLPKLSIEIGSDAYVTLHSLATKARQYEIASSENLISWKVLTNLVAQSDLLEFRDSAQFDGYARFYRVAEKP